MGLNVDFVVGKQLIQKLNNMLHTVDDEKVNDFVDDLEDFVTVLIEKYKEDEQD